MGTTPTAIARPRDDEYAPYYASYIARVPHGDVRELLAEQVAATLRLTAGIGEERSAYRYAPGKWSIKEILGHLIDVERIMGYRALRIARGDPTPLPGFEQDDYVREGGFDRRTLRDLGAELDAVRQATLHLFRHLDEDALGRRGTANGVCVTPRALAYIIAGHELHHVEILRARYL